MVKCLFDRISKLFKTGQRNDIPHDPVTHIQIELADFPDKRTDRWDDGTGIRAATQQELDDFDAADVEKRAEGDLNTPLNKALLDMFLDIEQRLRAAGQNSTISEIAAATNKAEYKTAVKDIYKTHT